MSFIRHLHISEDCLDHPYAQEIIERTGLKPKVLRQGEQPQIPGSFPDNLHQGKQHLVLCRNRGRFFKPCPATRQYLCCEYHVLNIGMGCPFDCVYCILQAYLNNPWISFFVNVEDLLAELDSLFAEAGEQFFRIGTGEFTDSLALDQFTGLSPILVNYMRDKPQAVLELKTKSVEIARLEGLDHRGRTVLAWSLNSPTIMAKEEIRTAGLEERLKAAARAARWGYRLAFHFDPIIWHQDWQEGYRFTIQRLFRHVPAEQIAWISLGALRYLPALKNIAARRFPGSHMFYEESIEGLDGKSRYFRGQRVEMYKVLVEELHKYVHPSTCLYFCMESKEIWQEVLGLNPEKQGGLRAMLDAAVLTPIKNG
jgi:spore photoproduct lyase